MANTINGDSGAVSGTAGVKVASDGTGVLAIQTNGTTAMTVDASQNVGIGTTPLTNTKLTIPVQSADASTVANFGNINIVSSSTTGYPAIGYNVESGNASNVFRFVGADNVSWIQFIGNSTVFARNSNAPSAGGLVTSAESMRIDGSGNVGIGTTSPSAPLSIAANTNGVWRATNITNSSTGSSAYTILDIGNNTGSTAAEIVVNSSANTSYAGANGVSFLVGYGELLFQTQTSSKAIRFAYNGGTESGRFDGSGNFLVGTTSTISGARVSILNVNGGQAGIGIGNTGGSSLTTTISFRNSNGEVGTIQTTGSTTNYNTSSDYRLKENVQPMQNALEKLAALKPCTFDWKADGTPGQGFIAHELQAVVPECVSGEKDAVDEEGNPKYQGIDTSFLVATLTAAIQELTARVAALEGK